MGIHEIEGADFWELPLSLLDEIVRNKGAIKAWMNNPLESNSKEAQARRAKERFLKNKSNDDTSNDENTSSDNNTSSDESTSSDI